MTLVGQASCLLQLDGVRVDFPQHGGRQAQVLKGIDMTIAPGETVGLVGESGSGKTTLGRVILGLVQPSAGRVVYDGRDLTHDAAARRRVMGREIQVVFQDPYGSLNPALPIGQTLSEPLLKLPGITRDSIRTRVAEVLARVGMPTDTALRYPGQFSGGQRQRIAIARAVIGKPRLLVCDEPVSALDLSVQAQVLNLLNELQRSMGLAMLFISHDLAVVRHVSHRTLVLYQGEIVEQGDSRQLHEAPIHPYTRALLQAAPVPDPLRQRARRAHATP